MNKVVCLFLVIQEQVELTRVTLIGPITEEKLQCACDIVIETTQDFTDSAYTSHDNREKIVHLTECLKMELDLLLKVGQNLVQVRLGGCLKNNRNITV